jgi:hypothetical protein
MLGLSEHLELLDLLLIPDSNESNIESSVASSFLPLLKICLIVLCSGTELEEEEDGLACEGEPVIVGTSNGGGAMGASG